MPWWGNLWNHGNDLKQDMGKLGVQQGVAYGARPAIFPRQSLSSRHQGQYHQTYINFMVTSFLLCIDTKIVFVVDVFEQLWHIQL
jgi:hypothetical protein